MLSLPNNNAAVVGLGTPGEVANRIVFLASDLASCGTSSVWGVDGGSVRSIV